MKCTTILVLVTLAIFTVSISALTAANVESVAVGSTNNLSVLESSAGKPKKKAPKCIPNKKAFMEAPKKGAKKLKKCAKKALLFVEGKPGKKAPKCVKKAKKKTFYENASEVEKCAKKANKKAKASFLEAPKKSSAKKVKCTKAAKKAAKDAAKKGKSGKKAAKKLAKC